MAVDLLSGTEEALPAICTGRCALRHQFLQYLLEKLDTCTLLHHRSWQQVVHIEETKKTSTGDSLLRAIDNTADLHPVSMLRLPRASVRPLGQSYVLRKVRGGAAKNTPMDDTKHSDVSSSAQRREAKLGKCLNLTDANVTQKLD